MYWQIDWKNYAYTYIHTFIILNIEFGRLDLNCFENQLNSFNSIVTYLNASFTAQMAKINKN